MRRLLTAFFLLHSLSVFSQKISLDQFKNWTPRNIGPAGMSGRITAIDVVIKHPDTWYLGAASGGVWKTENAGASWTPVFDEQPTLNIGSLAIQQNIPSVVWVGTGEGNPRNSLNIGEGIYRTLDGGKTWKRMGLEKSRNIHRIIIDPTNPDIIYAGAIGNPYAEHPERGVYKSSDGGETWNRILFTNESSGVADMVMDPSNPNKLIVAMWQHRRTPYSFKSGGPGSGLYITVDGGRNWKKLEKKDGLPEGELGRIGIAFARSMPSRVYAKVEAKRNGLYQSDDGGFTWTLINSKPEEVTDRPFYFQEIYVDPKNENRIYDIHSTVTYSEDGGRNFKTMLPYFGIHPDHHAWWIHPDNPDFILDGNDGGIGISRDRGKSWVFDDKIPVSQFYHINVDNEIPYNVMGGMQDNGSWHGPAYTWINGGIRNYYWNNVGSGDGFDVVADPEDPSWVYSMSQGGSVGRLNYKTGERWFIRPVTADTSQKYRFNWNAAIAVDPIHPNTVYYGSQFLHRSTNKGASWDIISGDLTTNNPQQQNQDETGGLTLDITGAENYNTIMTIAPSYKESGVIWVGTDDGNVQLTRDGGKSWTNFRGKIPGLPVGAWIPQVRAGQHGAGEVFVVANDYRRGDFKPYIFRTTDYGRTWTRLIDENKVRGYALSVIQDPVEPNLIFVGTEHGLWISLDNGASFQQWKNGYPSVSTYDLAIQEREADLVIGTFGRSVWILDDIRPLRKLAADKGSLLQKNITAFTPPDAFLANFRAAPGYEWSTYGLYDAENRKKGAAVSFYVAPSVLTSRNFTTPPPSAKSDANRNGNLPRPGGSIGEMFPARGTVDSVNVRIYNAKNEIIRNLKWKADTGFNRQWWGLEERGVRAPGSPRPRANAPEPGGLQVLPGTYKIVISLGKDADSTTIVVNDDPRIKKSADAIAAQRKMVSELRNSSSKLTEAMDRLSEWEEVLTKIQSQLRGVEDKTIDSLNVATTILKDSIKSIREFIVGKTSDRQGITRTSQVTVMNRMQTAQQYIMAKSVAPGEQEQSLVKGAEAYINEALKQVNRFYEKQWKPYKTLAEGTRIPLFREYPPLELIQ
jgi:photosystem II stability/assembly factor-like uncharacterized protein